MRKLIALVIALGTILCACAGGAPGQSGTAQTAGPSAMPIPTPTPTPKPLHIGVFISPDSDAAQSAQFAETIADIANERGMTSDLLEIDGANGAEAFEGCDAVIAYAARGFDFAAFAKSVPDGVAVAVYTEERFASPTSAPAPNERLSLLYYADGLEIGALYEAALTYPPHDTPVRLAGMFESEESPAAVRLEELYQEGKALPKARFFADGERTSMEWLPEFFEKYIEGTVDGIVAENAELALAALQALKLEGRSDMEIFCMEQTEETLDAMAQNPIIFVAAVGTSAKRMAAECLDIALLSLDGEEGRVLAFAPTLSDDAPLIPAERGFGIADRLEPTPTL